MNFINCTPHDLNIVCESGSIATIPPSGKVARVSTTRIPYGTVEWCDERAGEWLDHGRVYDEHGCDLGGASQIQFSHVTTGDVVDLPDPVDGVVYVVSSMVLAHPSLCGRNDLASPGELLRDDAGRPIGCSGLTACPGLADLMQVNKR